MASDAVERIKERLSIVDVVAPYVELHKAGKNYKGKSPFTSEKTPSFYVSPDRGMYYCFSSSQGGDIFTFVEKMEGVDFKGALKLLAEKAGIELVPEDPKKRSERETDIAITEAASTFFVKWLTEKDRAYGYLTERGVTAQTIAAWRIGYAPGPPEHGWRHLREHLKEKSYTDAQMVHAGLIKPTDAGKEPYDVFRDRIMFPICDPSGRVIAFSGRILAKDSEAPKYVNSPETPLFNKSEALFGYDKAKQGIRHYDFSLIVEGQFDVVLSHQAGYTNAVAVSGTALTGEHVALLQRLSNRVVLALDADRAGIAAVRRAADLMLARGMDVKVARLPEGEDPADIIRKDPKQFKDLIGHATHVIEFLLAVLKEEARDARAYKLRVRDEILPYLLRIENHIDREHFAGIIAAALDTMKDSVMLEVERLAREQTKKTVPPVADSVPLATMHETRKESGSARKTALIQYFVALSELLEEHETRVLHTHLADVTGTEVKKLREEMPPEVMSPLLFTLEGEVAELKRRELHHDIVHRLQELRGLVIKDELRTKRDMLRTAEAEGDESVVATLTDEVSTLQRKLSESPIREDIFIERPEAV